MRTVQRQETNRKGEYGLLYTVLWVNPVYGGASTVPKSSVI